MNEKQEKKGKTRIFIQVSLSEKEKELIQETARKEHTNASNLMRTAIFEYMRMSMPVIVKKEVSIKIWFMIKLQAQSLN